MKRTIFLSIIFLSITTCSMRADDSFALPMQRRLEAMATELEAKLAGDRSKMPVVDVVKDFKADNKGERTTTAELQKAIDAAARKSPCRVRFPAGTYVTGTLFLRSGVHIELDNGATILGSVDIGDYPEIYPAYKSNTDLQVNKSLFYAEQVSGISLTGQGTIDFRGTDKLYTGTGNNDPRRPFGIRIVSSRNIYVSGLYLKNSPQWLQHYLDCDSLMVENIEVFNHAHQNNDGIDIDGCRNVYIRNCRIDSDDDAICLKSNGPSACENVLVENCIAASHCNALKLGTETTGGFRNILYRKCKVVQSVTGHEHVNGVPATHTAITLIVTDGGAMENVWFDDIEATECVTPIFVTLGSRSRIHTPSASRPAIGLISGILISNFKGDMAGPICSMATGLDNEHRIKNLTLRNIRLEMTYPGTLSDRETDMDEVMKRAKPIYPSPHAWKSNLPASGLYFRYIDGLTLDRVTLDYQCTDPRDKIIIRDCNPVVFNY